MGTVLSVIPTLRVTPRSRSRCRCIEPWGLEVAWQHQLEPAAPRLTAVARDSAGVFLTDHPVAPIGAVVHSMVEGLRGGCGPVWDLAHTTLGTGPRAVP